MAHTYYTMAIYQNSYGMTDMRKPEFKLKVTTWEVASAQKALSAAPLTAADPATAPASGQASPASTWIEAKLQKALEFFS